MVLKIAADLRRIDHNRDPQAREVIGWPDARQHQELGRVDSAAAQNDLTLRPNRLAQPILEDLDPARSTVLDHDTGGDRPGQ